MTKAELLDTLFAEFIPRTQGDPLLLLQEGHFKCEMIRSLLSMGCTVQEASPNAGNAYFLSKAQVGTDVEISEKALVLKPVRGSVDAAVTDPVECMFEFKVRPNIGSSSQAAHQAIEKDLRKVCADARVIALIGFEHRLYKSFSGTKTESRGRPTTSVCQNMLLPLARLEIGSTSSFQWNATTLYVRYYQQPVSGYVVRVFVAIMQDVQQEQTKCSEDTVFQHLIARSSDHLIPQ